MYRARAEQNSTGVSTAVLLGITSVVVYIGLVVIGFEIKKDWFWEDEHVPDVINVIFDGAGKSFC